MIFRYRRYFGVVVTHYTAMVYSARYAEMVEVLGQTLFYLNPNAPVQLDSPLSDLPRQVKVLIWWLIPSKCALDLIQHSLFSYEWPPLLNIHVLWPYSVRIVIVSYLFLLFCFMCPEDSRKRYAHPMHLQSASRDWWGVHSAHRVDLSAPLSSLRYRS